MSLIHEVCKEALAESDDSAEALERVEKRFNEEPDLLLRVLDEDFWPRVKQLLRQCIHEARSRAWSGYEYTGNADDIRARAEAELLDFRISTGKRLRSCDHDAVVIEAKMYEQLVRGNRIRASWFWGIARALPNRSTSVGQSLSEEKLRELQKRAKKSVREVKKSA